MGPTLWNVIHEKFQEEGTNEVVGVYRQPYYTYYVVRGVWGYWAVGLFQDEVSGKLIKL